MAVLHILILSVIPVCLAQFSIQGPSDGNRAAQSLRYSDEKGIEYSDQSDSSGSGDFSIQGATDGNSNFHIQGASDGNADFQIQGATDGNSDFKIQGATDGNANFQIQGATDGNANFQIQGATGGNANHQIQGATNGNFNYQNQGATNGGYQSPIQTPYYDTNQGNQRSLQYDDTNGFKLNWKSYAHGQLSPQPQRQPHPQQQPHPQPAYTPNEAQAQYAPEPAPRPVTQPAPQPTHQGEERDPVQQPINYRPYDNAPAQIKQLLQFQSQIPYLNAIPEHLRYDAFAHQQRPQPQSQPQEAAPPTQHRPRPHGHQRSKRQTHQHQGQQSQQPQQHQQPEQQYRRIPQPTVEPTPRYSTNVPSQIKQILQFQSQIPYLNAIPEQFRYNLDSAPASVQPYQSHGGGQNPSQGNHRRAKRQAHQKQQQPEQQQQPQQQYRRIPQPAAEPQHHYSTNVPPQIKQLLQFQSQIPYVNAIPEHLRYENLQNVPAQSQHQNLAGDGHQRGKRQAQNHPQQQQQNHQQPQQQYKRIPQPAPEPQPNYSTNVPSQIKQLLQFQSQIPYVNAIPEQFRYNLENVHHAAQSSAQPSTQTGHQRGKRQAQNNHQQQQQPQHQYKRISQPAPEPQPNYSTNVPSQIKQLLQFQSQIPYVNAIPEQFRYNLENVQHAAQDSPQSGHRRGKREAQSQQGHEAEQQQYRRIPQPAPEAQPQYSINLPSSIQQLLKFQAQTPYDIIANQIIYRPDKPYVPQPVSSPASTYQSQNQGDIRPVTEHE